MPGADANSDIVPQATVAATPKPSVLPNKSVATSTTTVSKVTITANSAAVAAAALQTPEQRIDSAILTIARYRTSGDGGNALKLLLTFVKNVAENPTEVKYVQLTICFRSLNLIIHSSS